MPEKPTYEELEKQIRDLKKTQVMLVNAKAALRDSEEKYNKTFECITDSITITRIKDGLYLYVNNGFCNQTGYSREEVLGRTPSDINLYAVPAERDQFIGILERFGKAENILIHFRRKNGEIYYSEFSAAPIIFKGEKCLLAQSRDITEQKLAEKALREREKQYRLLVENMSDVVWIMDMDFHNTYVSPSVYQQRGFTSEEVKNQSIDERISPDSIEKVLNLYSEKLKLIEAGNPEGWETVEFEIEQPCKDGSSIWTSNTVKMVPGSDKKPASILGKTQDITARKKAEDGLKANYTLLQIAGETAKFGGWSVDLENNICAWSDAVADIHDVPHGYAPPVNEAINFYAPKWREKIAQCFRACAKDGIPYDEGMEIITQKGKRVWVRAIGRAVKNKKNKIIKVQGSFQDITDQKETEESLRESEEMMRNSQSVAHICSYSTNLNADEIEKSVWVCSPEFYNIFGIDKTYPHTIAGWANFIHPDYREEVFDYHESVVKEKKTFSREYKIIRINDGEERWVHGTGKLEFDEKGNPVRMHGAIQDITEHKNAEDALLAEKLFSESLVSKLPGVFYLISEEGKFLRWNTKFEEVTGRSAEEMAQISPMDLFEGEDKQVIASAIQRVFTHGQVQVEGRFVTKDRKRIPYQFSGAKIIVDGAPSLIGIGLDITGRKQTEEQLRQAQKMESVGTLAGGVAHDFNNMLSIILGNAEIIMEDIDPSNPLVTNLEEIYKAAERSANLTKQLLAFARKQTINPKILNLNHALDGMLKMLKRLIGEDIDLTWQPSQNLWSVKIDPSQIDQILANLCVNARDAIKGVGKVTIETDNISFDEAYCKEHAGFNPGDYVMMAVSDNGSGMDKKVLDNLFEPFFTTKDIGQGTGLGLATVYGIVKQNNGFINVYSEIGEGTTFKIYIPVHSETAVSNQKDFTKTSLTGNETILLVEDEKAILRMTKMMLERLGYTVLTASRPNEAISIVEASNINAIHLLITDVVMPEMNGRDLSKKLLNIYPGLKCLFMSGYTANVVAHHGVLDTGVQFINKPFSTQDLATKVREVLDEERGSVNP